MICTTLVILMTPAGLTLFYGGLANYKNVLNTIGLNYVAFCLATLIWYIISYSLTYSDWDNSSSWIN